MVGDRYQAIDAVAKALGLGAMSASSSSVLERAASRSAFAVPPEVRRRGRRSAGGRPSLGAAAYGRGTRINDDAGRKGSTSRCASAMRVLNVLNHLPHPRLEAVPLDRRAETVTIRRITGPRTGFRHPSGAPERPPVLPPARSCRVLRRQDRISRHLPSPRSNRAVASLARDGPPQSN